METFKGYGQICKPTFTYLYPRERYSGFYNPVPYNILQGKPLDTFLKELLEDQHKTKEKAWDSTLEKIQCKVVSVLGPLSKVWDTLEAAKKL